MAQLLLGNSALDTQRGVAGEVGLPRRSAYPGLRGCHGTALMTVRSCCRSVVTLQFQLILCSISKTPQTRRDTNLVILVSCEHEYY